MRARKKYKIDEPEFKIVILKAITFLILGIITMRLFYLQVIQNDHYLAIAAREHYGYTELPARRGEIFIKDYASGEDIRVATNITLDTLYADPTLIQNPKLVTDRIVPIIFNLETERLNDNNKIETTRKRAQTQEELDNIKSLTDEELYTSFHASVLEKLSQKIRPEILLSETIEGKALEEIQKHGLNGLEVKDGKLYAYPNQITDREYLASFLSKYIDLTPTRLEQILQGKNRYVILSAKISPEMSAQIKQIINEDDSKNFFGLGLNEEYYRYYPEDELASNVLGFVTPNGVGQYGIESSFNSQLQGKKGVFQTQRDGSIYGRQITVGDSLIQPAVDGDSIVLTIDRSMQMRIESMLEKAVKDYRADSGQVVVLDPDTGKIMAMAHYPNFNPNSYSDALKTEEINLNSDEVAALVPIENEENAYWFYRNVIAHDRYKVMKETVKKDDGEINIFKRYKNWIGLEAYQNKITGAPYEPGSVFKTITMAAAIDDKDVTPQTAFRDSGVLEVDEFKITNVSSACTGYVTMTNVIEYSCNTGVGWVAQKMGRNLFYSYIMKFGFGERTGVEFDNDHPGQVEHFTQWADSELATHAFGQGLTVTPLQMANSYAAIANGGTLMQPYIVEKVIQKDGQVVETNPVAIHKVITEETAHKITAMLVSAVENGVAGNAKLDNYYVAAKTGTSQTYRNGKPLTGAGTTIGTIVGYGPIEKPKFVLLVKFDRTRSSEWGGETAAKLYSEIAAYLYEYLGVPPDKK